MNQKFFLVILNLYNSKTTCDRRKQILDLESTSKNTLAGWLKEKKGISYFSKSTFKKKIPFFSYVFWGVD